MTTTFTHKDLCIIAAKWLKNTLKCTISINEPKGIKENPWTGNSYLDMYYATKDSIGEWKSPELLPGCVNGEYHEASPAFTKDAGASRRHLCQRESG